MFGILTPRGAAEAALLLLLALAGGLILWIGRPLAAWIQANPASAGFGVLISLLISAIILIALTQWVMRNLQAHGVGGHDQRAIAQVVTFGLLGLNIGAALVVAIVGYGTPHLETVALGATIFVAAYMLLRTI